MHAEIQPAKEIERIFPQIKYVCCKEGRTRYWHRKNFRSESNRLDFDNNLRFRFIFLKSLSGAPLVCSFKTMIGLRYVQYGMLSQATEYNRSPHLFVNLHNFKNWIEKNLSVLK